MDQITLTKSQEQDTVLSFLARAVKDPAIDVTKLEALLRIKRDIDADQAKVAYFRAMLLAQAEMQPVVRNATNDQTNSRYATLERVDAAIRPIYMRHGFFLSFGGEPIDGPNIRIACDVIHEAGHARNHGLDAALDVTGPKGTVNKSPLHGLGSSVSYLRRYLTCMVFNVILSNEDHDGNQQLRQRQAQQAQPPRLAGGMTQGQYDELLRLMDVTQTNEGRFLMAMTPGLRALADAQAGDFPRLRNALLTKQHVMRQRGEITYGAPRT